ncbi:MAG: VWA domain-containing protein [Planctomycetes bacterium]|nr:VWA domain-containing protein [Planctomycetota bacterium]
MKLLGAPLAALAALATLAPCALAQETPEPTPAERPAIDVAFVLDTTGSMGGLIDGAKKKIWSIVNTILSGRPLPEVRVALVGYRDQGDDYVTKRHDFTDNIDEVFSNLSAFQAAGGGDEPEYVELALKEAIDDLAWKGDATLKILFLVGDAPPHEYEDELDLPTLCERAVKKDIIVNTIRCGDSESTGKVWQEIARLAEGRYHSIDQTGGVVAVATPYDEEIGRMNDRLVETRLIFGSAEYQAAAGDRLEAQKGLDADAKAGCAEWNSANARLDRQDLLDSCSSLGIPQALDQVKVEDLPEDLKGKSREEQEKALAERLAARQELQGKIAELAKKRDEYVKAELEKQGAQKDSFDEKVVETLKDQAEERGLSFEK